MSAVVPFYIKTAYHDEPSFANTKVVTSLFNKTLDSNLSENFKKSMEFKEADAAKLKKYNDLFNFNELGRLAIDYSDGIIEAHPEVDAELIKYAEDNNKRLLRFPGEEFADDYEAFYEKLLEE